MRKPYPQDSHPELWRPIPYLGVTPELLAAEAGLLVISLVFTRSLRYVLVLAAITLIFNFVVLPRLIPSAAEDPHLHKTLARLARSDFHPYRPPPPCSPSSWDF